MALCHIAVSHRRTSLKYRYLPALYSIPEENLRIALNLEIFQFFSRGPSALVAQTLVRDRFKSLES
jgi:hypothetical protein